MACSSPTAESYYRQGRELREADEPVAAMKAFIAATRVHSREYGFKARSWSNMATMCRIGERHDLAYSLYEQSLAQFVLAKDTLAQAYAFNNMAWEQAVQGNKEEATSLIEAALGLCADSAVQQKVLESRAAACLYADEYDSVLFYTNKASCPSLYFDMLQAQAYTFLGHNDSALYYAKRVVTETDNPRYLDDAYYVLVYCDAAAGHAELVERVEKRTDVQRELTDYKSEMAQAVLLLQEYLNEKPSHRPWLICLAMLAALGAGIPLGIRLVRVGKRRKIARIAAELHQNNQPKTDIPWDLCHLPDKLNKRGFSERETRIAVLVLLGFTYAQMADILNRAENGIGKDKYLIAKKLGVSVKDLQNRLMEIACRN